MTPTVRLRPMLYVVIRSTSSAIPYSAWLMIIAVGSVLPLVGRAVINITFVVFAEEGIVELRLGTAVRFAFGDDR